MLRNIGMMAWRIGERLDIHEQIEWIRRAGFGGVGFHACAGTPGQWQGIDPAVTTAEARARLRERLSGFPLREVHAPVALLLNEGSLRQTTETLIPIVDFAGDVAATVVTIHARPPASSMKGNDVAWDEALGRLDAAAARNRLVIGLEITGSFEWIARQGLANMGVTLDVGHMLHHDGRALRDYGTLGEVARRLGRSLVHLHLHDHDGVVDHVELGTGRVDFDDLLEGLRAIGYAGGACLELNPDRASPQGILRSLEWLRRRTAEHSP